jgi:hypothetical protein
MEDCQALFSAGRQDNHASLGSVQPGEDIFADLLGRTESLTYHTRVRRALTIAIPHDTLSTRFDEGPATPGCSRRSPRTAAWRKGRASSRTGPSAAVAAERFLGSHSAAAADRFSDAPRVRGIPASLALG